MEDHDESALTRLSQRRSLLYLKRRMLFAHLSRGIFYDGMPNAKGFSVRKENRENRSSERIFHRVLLDITSTAVIGGIVRMSKDYKEGTT